MLLQNKFYKVLDSTIDAGGNHGQYRLALLPDCEVYKGHFPGHAVCPGVFNIETIKECAMMLTGRKLAMPTVKQCRFTAVASPAVCPQVDLDLTATATAAGAYLVEARITAGDVTYVEFKGEMTAL